MGLCATYDHITPYSKKVEQNEHLLQFWKTEETNLGDTRPLYFPFCPIYIAMGMMDSGCLKKASSKFHVIHLPFSS